MSVVRRVRVSARGIVASSAIALCIMAVARPMPSAFAQATTLTANQLVGVRSAVQTALANIDPSLGVAARNQEIDRALAQVAATLINQDGEAALAPLVSAAIEAGVPAPQAIQPILPVATGLGIPNNVAISSVTQGAVSAGASPVQTAEAVIAVAPQAAVTSAAVGTGLGQAAAALSTTNPGAATAIALVIANEAPISTGQAFGSSVVANGGSQQLAVVAQQNPTASFITGALNNNGNNSNGNRNNNGNANNNGNNGNANNNAAANNNSNFGIGNINNVSNSNLNSISGTGNTPSNAPTVSLGSGASQQISAVGTTITCTTPSCS